MADPTQAAIRFFYQPAGGNQPASIYAGASPNVPYGFKEIDLTTAQNILQNSQVYDGGQAYNQAYSNQGINSNTEYGFSHGAVIFNNIDNPQITSQSVISGNLPGSGIVAQWTNPSTGEVQTNVPVSQINQQMQNIAAVQAGTMKNIGTASAPMYVPNTQAQQIQSKIQQLQSVVNQAQQMEYGVNQDIKMDSNGNVLPPNQVTGVSNSTQAQQIHQQIQALQGQITTAQNAGYGPNDQIQYDSQGNIVPKSGTGTGGTGGATNATGTSTTGDKVLDSVLNGINTFLQRLASNGTTINPNVTITPDMAAAFMNYTQNNISQFVPYATNEIAPYYQNQLALAKSQFLTSVGYNEQQQLQVEQDIQQNYNQQLKDLGASLAEQGFAQSGTRSTQENQLAYNTNRQIQQGRQALGYQTQQAAQTLAQNWGTTNVPGVNITGATEAGAGSPLASGTGSSPLYSLSDAVYQGLKGTQQYQQEVDIQNRAGQLANAFQQYQGAQQQRQLTV